MEKILEILGGIGFDWKVALANFVNFLIVFYLLNRFIFSRIRTTLKERKSLIEKGVEDARKAETALVMAKEQEEALLKEARAKANTVVADAQHRGNELIKVSEEKGRVQEASMLERAEALIQKKHKEAERIIAESTASLVVDGVRKMLLEQVQGKKNDEFIDKLIKKG